MNIPLRKSNNNISFGVALYETSYSQAYLRECPNGNSPDKIVMQALQWHYPEPRGVDVLDLGAGDGRNALPIAQKGYNVTACEICPEGNEKIRILKEMFGLNNLTIKTDNILKRIRHKVKQYHFAFMAHVTQHFSPADLRLMMLNLHQQVKDKGYVLFDALIRKPGYEDFESTELDEMYGSAHFKQDDVTRIAGYSGFKILGILPDRNYNDRENTSYCRSALWGGANQSFNRPLELKWFLMQKKD